MNNTYCNQIKKGMFVSHQGISLCCVNSDKHHEIKPSDFWHGYTRTNALQQISESARVKGCDVCYKTEQLNLPSTRTFANSYDYLPEKNLPTMLDLGFSNFCNLKCIMCNSARSSEWAKDEGKNKENNGISSISIELIDDLSTISDAVEQITIQGGEATIMKEYEHYFELLDKKGIIGNIDLQIITNATNVNKKFYSLLENFKSVRLSVSIDAYGLANDYIRWPSKFDQLEKNLVKMSDFKNNVAVEILNTVNILSMFNYKDFLFWCKKIENVYDNKGKTLKIVPMKIQDPRQYSPFVAPDSLKEKFSMDIKDFLNNDNLKHNSSWKTEISLLLKKIKESDVDEKALKKLKTSIELLNKQRKDIKITNYIPNFHEYI